jgi:DNA polymerase III alpha subunit
VSLSGLCRYIKDVLNNLILLSFAFLGVELLTILDKKPILIEENNSQEIGGIQRGYALF